MRLEERAPGTAYRRRRRDSVRCGRGDAADWTLLGPVHEHHELSFRRGGSRPAHEAPRSERRVCDRWSLFRVPGYQGDMRDECGLRGRRSRPRPGPELSSGNVCGRPVPGRLGLPLRRGVRLRRPVRRERVRGFPMPCRRGLRPWRVLLALVGERLMRRCPGHLLSHADRLVRQRLGLHVYTQRFLHLRADSRPLAVREFRRVVCRPVNRRRQGPVERPRRGPVVYFWDARHRPRSILRRARASRIVRERDGAQRARSGWSVQVSEHK
jgi:hypothetical protein